MDNTKKRKAILPLCTVPCCVARDRAFDHLQGELRDTREQLERAKTEAELHSHEAAELKEGKRLAIQQADITREELASEVYYSSVVLDRAEAAERELQAAEARHVRELTRVHAGAKRAMELEPPVKDPPAAEQAPVCCCCMTSPRDVLFDPCGHVCACEECARKLDACPVCRALLMAVVRAIIV